MKRSAILAARARNQHESGGAGGGAAASSGSLPPFVHKASLPSPVGSAAAASSSVSSVAGECAAPASPSAAASAGVPLPRWNGDISKKSWKRDEVNARNREETARKKARRDGHGDDTTEQGGAAAAAAAAADAAGVREAPAPLRLDSASHMSAAKLKFIEDMKQQQQASRQTARPTDSIAEHPPSQHSEAADTVMTSAASAPSLSSASVAASSSAAGVPTSLRALPAFRPAKSVEGASPRKLPSLHGAGSGSGIGNGTGITPLGKKPVKNEQEVTPERYYNVGFCARSNKKHKNYEDGVLVVRGRKCDVKNMSSHTVSSCLASFSTERLEEGSIYFIASSEIELGTPIDPKEYLSGRCFVGGISAAPAAPTVAESRVKAPLTPFTKLKASNARGGVGGSEDRRAAAMAAMQQMLADPALMLLNRAGIIERDEKAVMVELFLSKQLRAHQREGVQWMYDACMGISSRGYEGCILADAMGLGKTLQAITLVYTLLHCSPHKSKGGECAKAIIVCPATLLNNWSREFTKWLGSHRCKPLVLTATLNAAEQQSRVHDFITGAGKDYSVLIVSYELFRKHADALSKLTSLLLVCDEGHRLKSTTANKTISALSKLKTRKRIMLTGTPVQNDLGEFFAMVDFINPSILGNLNTFRRAFEIPISRSRDVNADTYVKALGEARAEELAQRTHNFVLRRSSDLLLQYLPDKVEQVLFIPLTRMQADIYRALLRSKDIRRLLASGSGGPNDALSLQCINQLKKLANHPGLVYEDCLKHASGDDAKSAATFYPENYVPVANYADVGQSSKLAVLDHLLQAVRREGQKIVIVSNYIQTLDMLSQYLNVKGYHYLRLDGTTSAADRPSLVDRFNAPYASEHFVFLLSAKAGGVGLNLTGGNRLVLFDPDWNPAIDLQAMSRVWRDGQKSTVYIYRFLATATIDEKIYQRQLRKNELSCSILQGGSGSGSGASASSDAGRGFDAKTLRDIFSYRDSTRCETQEVLAKAKKSEEEQEEMQRNMGEFHTDLNLAKDPLLQSVPSHLVSSFLNRVSSAEENRRALAELAARAQQAMEKDTEREQGKENSRNKKAKEDTTEVEEEEEGEFDEAENIAPAASSNGAAAASHTSHHVADDDDGECEYVPPSATAASASVAAPSFTSPFTAPSLLGHKLVQPHAPAPPLPSSVSWPTAEEEEAAAEMIHDEPQEEEEEDAEEVAVPVQQHRSSGKKRSRHIQDDEDEEEQEETHADGSEYSQAAVAPVRRTSAPQLDAAAASIVPPTSPTFITLDVISSGRNVSPPPRRQR